MSEPLFITKGMQVYTKSVWKKRQRQRGFLLLQDPKKKQRSVYGFAVRQPFKPCKIKMNSEMSLIVPLPPSCKKAGWTILMWKHCVSFSLAHEKYIFRLFTNPEKTRFNVHIKCLSELFSFEEGGLFWTSREYYECQKRGGRVESPFRNGSQVVFPIKWKQSVDEACNYQ